MKNIQYGTEFLDQLKDKVHDLYDENKELKERNHKAIEYLKDNGIDNKMLEVCDIWDVNGIELFKILKGADKE